MADNFNLVIRVEIVGCSVVESVMVTAAAAALGADPMAAGEARKPKWLTKKHDQQLSYLN